MISIDVDVVCWELKSSTILSFLMISWWMTRLTRKLTYFRSFHFDVDRSFYRRLEINDEAIIMTLQSFVESIHCNIVQHCSRQIDDCRIHWFDCLRMLFEKHVVYILRSLSLTTLCDWTLCASQHRSRWDNVFFAIIVDALSLLNSAVERRIERHVEKMIFDKL